MERDKLLLSLCLVLAMLALVVGCAAPATTPAPTPTATPKPTATPTPASSPTAKPTPTQKVRLGQASNPMSSDWYSATVAIADLVTRTTYLDITVEAQSGPSALEPAVQKRLDELGGPISLQGIAAAYLGVGTFEGQPPMADLRLMINMGLMYQGFITSTRTGIKSVSDLKGRKIARYTAATNDYSDAILQAYGIDPLKDVTSVTMANTNNGLEALQAGRVDAINIGLVGTKILQLKEAIGSPVVLPIAPDKLTLAATQNPLKMLGFFTGYLKPGEPGYDLKEPVPVVANPVMIFTNKNVADDIIYTYVKTLLTHVKEVQAAHILVRPFSLDTAVPPPAAPYHPGAIKALKEANLWTDAHEKAQQQLSK